jgi:hypothetical protein
VSVFLDAELERRGQLEYNQVGMSTATASRAFWTRFRLGAAVAAGLLCASSAFAQDTHPSQGGSTPGGTQDQPSSQDKKDQKSSEPLTTKIRIQVNDPNDKPVSNASVYVRYYESGGFLRHEKLAELNFKTNQEGSVKVPAIPRGKILIQVIAKGWHTFGKWYDIDKEEESVSIKLEQPPHWY